MKPSDMEKRIIGCIKEHGLHGASSTEISKALGINRHTLAKYLNILNAEGKIAFKKAGMGKIWFMEKSPLHGVSNGSRDVADTGLKTTLGHILSTMPDGIVVENENYEIEFMNDSLIKRFGNRIGEKCYSAFIGRSEPCVKCPVIELLHKGNQASMRYQATDKDGNSYDLIASPIKNPDGSISVIEMVRDITDMKQAEEALRESEEEFRLTFENAKDAILWADPGTGLITNCNKAAETLLERERHEIIGQHQTKIHPPEKAEHYGNQFKEHIERKGAVDDEAEIITKSGEIKPVHISASVTVIGEKPIIQGIFHDITERKKAEDQIKYLNELKRSVIDNAPFGILTSDKEGNIIHANPALIEIMGSPSEEKTKSFNLFKLPAIKKAGLDKVFGKALMEGEEFNLEKEYVSHWGKKIFARIKVSPLRDSCGEINGLVTMVEDITEKMSMQKELHGLRKKAVSGTPIVASIPEAQSIYP